MNYLAASSEVSRKQRELVSVKLLVLFLLAL
jgi:hypothetical protein